MIEVLRTGVNTWECDQMGHMNVRHYFGRFREALSIQALHLGMGPQALKRQGLALEVVEQHVRFHGEMRPGVAFNVQAQAVEAEPDALRLYAQMGIVARDKLAATSQARVVLRRRDGSGRADWPADCLEAARAQLADVPAHGAIRGVSSQPPRLPPVRQEALERGMVGAYLGVVRPEDCDEEGRMTEAAFMACISDGIPHFFWKIRQEGARPENVGGAALEYRYAYHQRPEPGALIEVRSGLVELAGKAFRMCHWFFDLETGACVATSEAVAVSFDLKARRALPLPEETRELMQAHLIEGLSL